MRNPLKCVHGKRLHLPTVAQGWAALAVLQLLTALWALITEGWSWEVLTSVSFAMLNGLIASLFAQIARLKDELRWALSAEASWKGIVARHIIGQGRGGRS